jgi:RNA polymerase sigma-70 factor, ECF subfamily
VMARYSFFLAAYSLEIAQNMITIPIFSKLWFWLMAQSYHQNEDQIREEYEIVRKAQENTQYFNILYERYYESIFIFINRRLDDEDSSAELTTDVFLKSLQNIAKFEFRGLPFSAWLFKIAINEINLYFRKRKNAIRSVAITDAHIDMLQEELQENEWEKKHLFVTKLLEDLLPEEVQFLELRFFEGYTFKEMGYLLQMSEANAKMTTHRILKKLKEKAKKIDF